MRFPPELDVRNWFEEIGARELLVDAGGMVPTFEAQLGGQRLKLWAPYTGI